LQDEISFNINEEKTLLKRRLTKENFLCIIKQPTANSQQPTANSQQPTANSQQLIYYVLVVLLVIAFVQKIVY
jgi:hypothetical protein